MPELTFDTGQPEHFIECTNDDCDYRIAASLAHLAFETGCPECDS